MDEKKKKGKRPNYICCLQKTHFSFKNTHRLKMKGWKKILHSNVNQKRAGVAIYISDKIDFKSNIEIRDKEGHQSRGYNSNKYICTQH